MKKTFILGTAVSAMLLAGCGTTTETFEVGDGNVLPAEINAVRGNSVSSAELRRVAQTAAGEALTNNRFIRFQEAYKARHPGKLPVVKLAKAVVEGTVDNDIHLDELTDQLMTILWNADKVDISMAEGVGAVKAISASRNLIDDENFDQSLIARENSLIAAGVVLVPKIIENAVTSNGKKVVTRTFVLKMGFIENGLVIWQYVKQLGHIEK
jgi:lipoprotein